MNIFFWRKRNSFIKHNNCHYHQDTFSTKWKCGEKINGSYTWCCLHNDKKHSKEYAISSSKESYKTNSYWYMNRYECKHHWHLDKDSHIGMIRKCCECKKREHVEGFC